VAIINFNDNVEQYGKRVTCSSDSEGEKTLLATNMCRQCGY